MKPTPISDTVVAGAWMASLLPQIRDELSILVSILAALYYTYSFYVAWKKNGGKN